MIRSMGRLGSLALAFAPLAIVWLVARPAAVPLYDGIGLPQEPYRYLQPPAGQPSGLPPSAIHKVAAISNGNSPVYKVGSSESPPQVYFLMQYRALRVPAGVTQVHIDVRAIPPPARAPAGSVIDGNVYRFSVTTPSGAPVPLRGQPKAGVELRGTGASGSPTIAQYAGGSWRKLATLDILGLNYYIANVTSLGDFTLLLPAKSQSGSGGGVGGALPLIIAGVLILGLAVAAIVLIRLSRARTPTAAP